MCGDVIASARRGRVPGGPFDAVLIDPPYALGSQPAIDLVEALRGHGLLADGAVVMFERTSSTPALSIVGFETVKEKRYGHTCIDLLRME